MPGYDRPMDSLKDLLERMRRGAVALEEAMTGATPAEIDFTPAPGRWTIRQILAHLADAEVVGTDRFRRTIAEDNPTLIGYDQEAWNKHLDHARRNPADDLDLFRRLRALNSSLLDGLAPEAFERPATHTERGRLTLLGVLEMYADHAEGHARQIRGNREAFRARAAGG